MKDIYEAAYKGALDVGLVNVAAYFNLKDKYGNTSDGCVYRTELEAAEAKKINWANITSDDMTRIWTTLLIHPDLRK